MNFMFDFISSKGLCLQTRWAYSTLHSSYPKLWPSAAWGFFRVEFIPFGIWYLEC